MDDVDGGYIELKRFYLICLSWCVRGWPKPSLSQGSRLFKDIKMNFTPKSVSRKGKVLLTFLIKKAFPK